MNVLVTGSTGFVGRHLIPHLVSAGYNTTALVRNSEKFFSLFPQSISDNVNVISINDKKWKDDIKKRNIDNVIHLASLLTSKNDSVTLDQLLDVNIFFSSHLLNALEGSPIKCFINTGSFTEYMNNDGRLSPSYLYAATKTSFRHILKYYSEINHFKYFHIIPYTIYGDEDTQPKLIDYIINSLTSTSPISMSPGEQILDFIHIDDVVKFYLLALRNNELVADDTEIFLGSGTGSSPKTVAKTVEELSGKKTKIKWGALPYRERDTLHCVAPITILQKLFNWKPSISLKEGIKMYMQQQGMIN